LKHVIFDRCLKIHLLILIWLTGSSLLFSQKNYYSPKYDDAQFWQNIYVETYLTHKLNIHINEEGRITENITRPSYIYADLGITYKFKKYLHFTLAYVPIASRLQTDFISYRHQFYFDWVLKLKYKHFIFYYRQMTQSQYDDVNRKATWNIASYYLRDKITIKYKTPTNYIPYVATEIYYHANYNQYNGTQTDHARYYVGCFYKLNKVDVFELYYLIEPYFHIPSPYTNYIIGIGYAHNLY
jgi:hypothetical protein